MRWLEGERGQESTAGSGTAAALARAPLELQPRAKSPIGAPAGGAMGGEAVLEGSGKGEVCYSNLNLC